ncbi:PTS sugar transporter subunit IIA [Ligilactobacillus sp. WILCCON 0076]|uniref:Ascorbate-specific PTS system EIIA component n=1 Tax=Ligilactobacillus ubinensis TaxID=2876789 RepID=A0A9X2FM14_9LACO|nr:PTS sugar transporter subunit IIA [Ligilactobacillus ubinensis]MCP0888017.1 PTS sugar transporter subunit IIA [Ligilactobacillus ubinensis]
MIEKILKRELIQLNVEAMDWSEGIKKAAYPLEKNGYITKNYINAILDSVNKYGPYFVITPHVALSHAPSSTGAIKLAMGLCILKNPLKFNSKDNDPVKYIFTLSSPDSSSHLDAMKDLVVLLSDSKFYKELDNAKTVDEVLRIIGGRKYDKSISSM